MNEDARRPITDRRLARMVGVLARRQPDLAVALENVHDPHNVSAVIRSCDATGVASAHLVYPEEVERPRLSKGVAASAHRWLDIEYHSTIDDCYAALRTAGLTIYATYLGECTFELHEVDLTQPSAFVFGNESLGISEEARVQADATLKIPMVGMVDSLNISVAAAVILYEAMRQRRAAGYYDAPKMSEDAMRARLREWLIREARDPAVVESVNFSDALDIPPALNRYVPESGTND